MVHLSLLSHRPALPALALLTVLLPAAVAQGPEDRPVYVDGLEADWTDRSWGVTLNYAQPWPVYGNGGTSIKVSHDKAWGALALYTYSPVDTSKYDRISFWVHGGPTGGQHIRFSAFDSASNRAGPFSLPSLPANSYALVEFSMAQLGLTDIAKMWWQEGSGITPPDWFMDQVHFQTGAPGEDSQGVRAGPHLVVNASRRRQPINPLIYGMNLYSSTLTDDDLRDLGVTARRFGGNSTSRYNWLLDTDNKAINYYYENIPRDNDDPDLLPHGSYADRFVEQNVRVGMDSLITAPMIGWTPKSREYSWSFSVSKYGAQREVDKWRPDAGNGVRTDGSDVTGNDPYDTSVPADETLVTDWMTHLSSVFGDSSSGGVRFYDLDNEPMLWSSTHRDVHPTPASYDEVTQKGLSYAAQIKAADPGAQVLGPVSYGWRGYFYSAMDWAPGGDWKSDPKDRNNHGGVPFVAWYLQQMAQHEADTGARILDYLDLHHYPAAAGVKLAPAGDRRTQERRLRATRSLWDPTYRDESWIEDEIRLIPRMRGWVRRNYPGTKLAISEYNYGAPEHINGALAQADVLGIFGREGLDLAFLWSPPDAYQPMAYAYRMYRNYDDRDSRFGDISVKAKSGEPETVSVFAAERSADGVLTVMMVNKTPDPRKCSLRLRGFAHGSEAEVFQYAGSDVLRIHRMPPLKLQLGRTPVLLASDSITLFVVPPSGG